ncbi:MAG: hypothetical protein FWG63_10360 [Defluviitaleaceae bacterium]|nr:hypothetical protein [Defluviitaleaceae bacterium]
MPNILTVKNVEKHYGTKGNTFKAWRQTVVAFIFLAFVGCEYNRDNNLSQPDISGIQVITNHLQELPEISAEILTPLQEWLANCIKSPYSDFFPNSTFSHIVDVDGNGTPGVLAFRHEEDPLGFISPMGRVFYTVNSVVLYKNVGIQEGGLFSGITSNGRLVRAIDFEAEGGVLSYTLYEIIKGRLEATVTLRRETGYPNDRHFFFQYPPFFGDFTINWVDFEITPEEFREIMLNYGLDEVYAIWQLSDHTEWIFAGG